MSMKVAQMMSVAFGSDHDIYIEERKAAISCVAFPFAKLTRAYSLIYST